MTVSSFAFFGWLYGAGQVFTLWYFAHKGWLKFESSFNPNRADFLGALAHWIWPLWWAGHGIYLFGLWARAAWVYAHRDKIS